jgi:hypothetical protein
MKPLKIWHVVRLTDLQTPHLGVSQDVQAFEKWQCCGVQHCPQTFQKEPQNPGYFQEIRVAKLSSTQCFDCAGESMEEPLRYYHNITANVVNVLEAMQVSQTRKVHPFLTPRLQ